MQKIDLFSALAQRYPKAIHKLGKDAQSWPKDSGLDWSIEQGQLAYTSDGGKTGRVFPRRVALFRSDTQAPLSIVGNRFQIVQPSDVLKTYEELAEAFPGMSLAVAGQMDGGRRIWAAAQTPHTMKLPGKLDDSVQGVLLFLTSCDLTTSTLGLFNAFRLRCLNQLPGILSGGLVGKRNSNTVFRITHGSKFDPRSVVAQVKAMDEGWKQLERQTHALASKRVTDEQAVAFIGRHVLQLDEVLTPPMLQDMNGRSAAVRLFDTYHNAEGQDGIVGTAWGVVNAVTHYLDHDVRSRTEEARLRKAWLDRKRDKARIFAAAVEEWAPKTIAA